MRMTDVEINDTQRQKVQFKTFCPECRASRKDKNDPSLAVNLDEMIYNCHNCNAQGRFEDAPYTKPSERSKYAFKEKEYKELPPRAQAAAQEAATAPLAPEMLEYFKSRGISEQTVRDWKIMYRPSFAKRDEGGNPIKVDGIPQYRYALSFPFFERGKLVWQKDILPAVWSEDGKKKHRAFQGGKPVPFGLDRAGKRIVIVEGEIDAMSVYEVGIHEVWSVPSGVLNLNFFGFQSVIEAFQNADEIIVAVDQDESTVDNKKGDYLRKEIIERLKALEKVGVDKIYTVTFPDDCKDANDVLVKYGKDVLRTCIEDQKQPLPIDGIQEAIEFADQYMKFYHEGVPTGESTYIPGLDRIYRVMPGMFTILTGITNFGKSEVIDEIVRNMIREVGWKFAFFTPENNPMPLHMMKLAEKYIGKPFDQNKVGSMNEHEAQGALQWINENIYYINPLTQTFSISKILERARILKYRHGINGLIIDPWNYVDKEGYLGLREDQYINVQMQLIKDFCRETNIHVWLVVHPRTLYVDPKTNKAKVPTIHHLSGGSKFGDNCDFFFAVHRDPKEADETGIHKVEIHVQKSRYRYAAKQGSTAVLWNPMNGRLDEAADAPVSKPDVEGFDPDGDDF